MLPHQQRVVDEGMELSNRLTKLSTFLQTPTFHGLPYQEQKRLKRQELIMILYEEVLAERIAAFPPTSKEETK
jgi:hypothetical protein